MSPWPFLATVAAAAMVVPPTAQLSPETTPETTPEINPAQVDETSAEIIESKKDRYDRMTVPVTIGGQGPFRFMIDTGAQATVVTRGLTEKLNFQPLGSATLVAMGSRKPVQMVEVDGLEFAERTLNNIYAPMLEAQHIGADGILGLDSLQDMRVMIDFRKQTIAVNDSKALGGNKGYEIIVRARHKLGRLIITDAEVNGVKTALIVDTGAQGSYGNSELRRRMRARNPQEVSSTDVHGTEFLGDLALIRSLRIQDVEINEMAVTFAKSPVFAALKLEKRPALIIGMRDLRLFDRVAIDFATRRVLFDLPKGVQNATKRYPTRL